MTVLVVEDDVLVRDDIASYLRDQGCAVVEAATGERAIALCGSGMAVDVLFTDINLGGAATGWEVAEAFRAARPELPVVYASSNRVDRARCVPDSVFLSKPYRLGDVLSACRGKS
jgi:CheY-like chemotaxis protein